MSTTGDLVNLGRDVILTIGSLSLPIYKYMHPAGTDGTERFVINTIPNTQVRSGTLKQNNDLLNINFYVPKMANGEIDSSRIDTIDALVQNAFESYNASSSRVGYYYLNPGPASVFNESDKENLVNIRVETTYT
jgi:hypothetical protein